MAEGYVSGKPNVSWWITQVRKGIEFRKKYAREQEWELWRNYYRGNWKPGIMPSALYFKMLRTIVPRIYFRNPTISVSSAKPGYENMAFAAVLERVDNKLLRQMKVKQQMKKIVQNAFMFGTGVGKIGYGAQFSLIPDVGETTDPQVKGERFEYNTNVRPNNPWFMSVHPGNFIVPAGLANYEDTRWSAMWVTRPIEDVKNDPRFKNTKGMQASAQGFLVQADNMKTSIKRPVDMIDLVEIRDKKMGKVFVIAPFSGGDRTLYYDDDELFINGRHTFYPLVFNDDDEVFWGIPDSVVLDPLQREMNETKTMIMKHRRLSLIRLVAKRNSIKLEEAEKLVSELVSPIIWTDDDIDKAFKEMQTGSIPRDLFAAEQDIMQDTRETVGFSRNQFGEYKPGSSDTTATEAKIVAMASEIRVDERRDMLADILVDMTNDMHQVIFEQWTSDKVISLTGPQGLQLWVQFSGEMLAYGSYEVNVDPDSSLPETKDAREQKAVSIYNLLLQNPLFQADPQKLSSLTNFLLTEMNNVALEDLMVGLPQGIGLEQGNPMNLVQLGQAMANTAQAVGKRAA